MISASERLRWDRSGHLAGWHRSLVAQGHWWHCLGPATPGLGTASKKATACVFIGLWGSTNPQIFCILPISLHSGFLRLTDVLSSLVSSQEPRILCIQPSPSDRLLHPPLSSIHPSPCTSGVPRSRAAPQPLASRATQLRFWAAMSQQPHISSHASFPQPWVFFQYAASFTPNCDYFFCLLSLRGNLLSIHLSQHLNF